MTESLPEVPSLVTPFVQAPTQDYSVAALIDNTVYQVLNTDGQGAALFLANPTFIQVDKDQVSVGQIYDPETNTFSNAQ
jgi:hypothetical protein